MCVRKVPSWVKRVYDEFVHRCKKFVSIEKVFLSVLSSAALGVLALFLADFDKVSVYFVRWFWRSFFEQVVFAIGVLVVTSVSDVFPVVKRRFRLFD